MRRSQSAIRRPSVRPSVSRTVSPSVRSSERPTVCLFVRALVQCKVVEAAQQESSSQSGATRKTEKWRADDWNTLLFQNRIMSHFDLLAGRCLVGRRACHHRSRYFRQALPCPFLATSLRASLVNLHRNSVLLPVYPAPPVPPLLSFPFLSVLLFFSPHLLAYGLHVKPQFRERI